MVQRGSKQSCMRSIASTIVNITSLNKILPVAKSDNEYIWLLKLFKFLNVFLTTNWSIQAVSKTIPKVKVLMNAFSVYLWLISQTVQSRQLRQLGKASVIDAEMQVLVQDTEILIAALHNPTPTLQNNNKNTWVTPAKMKNEEYNWLKSIDHVSNFIIQLQVGSSW